MGLGVLMARGKSAKGAAANTVTVTLTAAMAKRLDALALRMEQTRAEAIDQAITEFVENWEDHLNVVAALATDDEVRPLLRTAPADGE